MTYYLIYNTQTEELSKAQVKCLNAECINLEVSKDIYDNSDKYIYLNGEVVLNPNYEEEQKQKEQERIAMLSLTKREIFLAIYKDKGLKPEDIRANVTDVEALIEFDYASVYYRGNPLIDKIGAILGYTSSDLDYLFQNKIFLNK